MQEKYDERYEKQIVLLTGFKIGTGNVKVFDSQARVIIRAHLPAYVEKGLTKHENCLVIANREGETMVITEEFERVLYNAIQTRGMQNGNGQNGNSAPFKFPRSSSEQKEWK